MKIVFLDAKTIGDDIDLSAFEKLGEVVTYNFSTTEEALERNCGCRRDRVKQSGD